MISFNLYSFIYFSNIVFFRCRIFEQKNILSVFLKVKFRAFIDISTLLFRKIDKHAMDRCHYHKHKLEIHKLFRLVFPQILKFIFEIHFSTFGWFGIIIESKLVFIVLGGGIFVLLFRLYFTILTPQTPAVTLQNLHVIKSS